VVLFRVRFDFVGIAGVLFGIGFNIVTFFEVDNAVLTGIGVDVVFVTIFGVVFLEIFGVGVVFCCYLELLSSMIYFGL
jgi:hypothetical protein